MGQEQTCCCKSKDKNDIELNELKNNLNNNENFESFISPNNTIINSLKNFIYSKKQFSLKKDNTNFTYNEKDKLNSFKKNFFKNDNIFLLNEKNDNSKKIYEGNYISNKLITINYFIILIQKIFRGFYYRKKIFPNKKINLENITLTKLKKLYNEYLTENLIKQEENIGIKHNENSYKEYFNIKKEIENNSKNIFTKLYILKYNNINAFYIGEININNNLNGRGILTLKDGTKYNGNFINNIFIGNGILIDKEGTLFKGNFKNGKLEGKGILKTLNGISYEGNFIKGKKNGFGKEETNEYIYEGEFIDDLKNGKGKLIYKLLNEIYEGTFEKNIITGEGIYKWNNGEIYKGKFINGKMNGGKYFWPDGSYYEGDYINNIKEGKGIFKWPNGKIFIGNFKNGIPFGNGILKVDNIDYKVNYINGKIEFVKNFEFDNKLCLNNKKFNEKSKIEDESGKENSFSSEFKSSEVIFTSNNNSNIFLDELDERNVKKSFNKKTIKNGKE